MPPTSKGEQARSEILDAAKHLFLSKGYSATSMRDIAKAAGGRAVAGLYNHFPTKEAIFKALIEERNPYEEIAEAITSGSGSTGPEFIASVLHKVMPMMSKHLDYVELIQIDLREFQGETVNHLLQETLLPRVAHLIAQIQMLPGLKPMEPFAIMRLLASTVIAFTLTQQIIPPAIRELKTPEAWITLYIETLLHGIASEGE
jgi:AcrR family transcriptional regulator